MFLQTTRQDPYPRQLDGISRLNVPELLDSLDYPVTWVHDEYLNGWVPVEMSDLPYQPRGRLPTNELRERALREGFVKVPQLVPAEYARGTLSSAYWRSHALHQRWRDMPGIKRMSVNNLPLVRLLHELTYPLVQSLVAEPIKTSYSFTSAYERGSSLPVHTDRPQCIYNVSLMLSGDPSRVSLSRWPLYIKHAETTNRVELNAGDAVVYSGTRDSHWRDQMPRALESVLGIFLHYVTESFEGSLD